MLWVFRRFFMCSGEGQQAHNGFISMHDTGFMGSCPTCGKVRACDGYSIMLPHRK